MRIDCGLKNIITIPIQTNSTVDTTITITCNYSSAGGKTIRGFLDLRTSKKLLVDSVSLELGLKPLISNAKQIQTSGTPVSGQSFFCWVAVSGSEPVHCVWYRGVDSLEKNTQNLLNFTSVGSQDEGVYYVKVSNLWGADCSLPYALILKKDQSKPWIIEQPRSQQVLVGSIARFQIRAGGQAVKFQWQQQGQDIPDAFDSVLVVGPVITTDSSKRFRCIACNPYGQDTSSTVQLYITNNEEKPTIISHPTDQQLSVGQRALFSVEARGTSLKYQWIRNSAEISAAISNSYQTEAVNYTDSGSLFQCKVYNSLGSELSRAAILRVLPVDKNRPAYFLSKTSDMFNSAERRSLYCDTLHAKDDDGDALIFALGDHPTDMTISDSIITWMPSEADIGLSFTVAASVTDGKGEYKLLYWKIEVKAKTLPTLVAPANKSIVSSCRITFSWKRERYRAFSVFLDTRNPPVTKIANDLITDTSVSTGDFLRVEQTYYWCVAGLDEIGEQDTSEVRTFKVPRDTAVVIFDDFKDAFGDEPRVPHLAAAQRYALKVSNPHYCSWEAVYDENGSQVLDEKGEKITVKNFNNMIVNQMLHVYLITSTSSDQTRSSAGLVCFLPDTSHTDPDELPVDLSSLDTIAITIKGKGTIRLEMPTFDVLQLQKQGEVGCFYGTTITLDENQWRTEKISVHDLKADANSKNGQLGWTWEHGMHVASRIHLMNYQKNETKDSELFVKEIRFIGMTYENFKFTYIEPLHRSSPTR